MIISHHISCLYEAVTTGLSLVAWSLCISPVFPANSTTHLLIQITWLVRNDGHGMEKRRTDRNTLEEQE